MDRYKNFISKKMKNQQNVIDFIYDEILPGIKDILSSYDDDQELVVRLIDYNGTLAHSLTRDKALNCSLDKLSIRIFPVTGRHINHSKEISNRILSEFGDYIKISSGHHFPIDRIMYTLDSEFGQTKLEFSLV